MSEREEIDIAGEFIDNPRGLYDDPGRLNSFERERLFEVEELMVASLMSRRGQYLRPRESAVSEEELARFAEHPEEAAGRADFPAIIREAGEVMAARRIMENSNLPAVSVPPVLREIIARENTDSADENLPSVILGLAQNGIEVIKSTLRGIALQPQAFTYTRSAPTQGVLEKQPRIELHQVFSDAPDVQLEYQIMRESASELMLSIRFKGMRRGTYSVSLFHNKRVIASHNLSDSQNMVTFGRLASGSYMIEIKGSFNYKFGILIDDSEL